MVAEVLWRFMWWLALFHEACNPQGRWWQIRCRVGKLALHCLHLLHPLHCAKLEEMDHGTELVAFLLGEGMWDEEACT